MTPSEAMTEWDDYRFNGYRVQPLCKCDQCWERWQNNPGYRDWLENAEDVHSFDTVGGHPLEIQYYRECWWRGMPHE